VKSAVVVKNLSQAMSMIKEMNVTDPAEWSGDYHVFERRAIAEVLNYCMKETIADHLHRLADGDGATSEQLRVVNRHSAW
jgi:hypothetical protein